MMYVIKYKYFNYIFLYILFFSMPVCSDSKNQLINVFSGLEFKITNAAFSDFSIKINSYLKNNSELDIFLSKVENYKITVKSTVDFYSVTFSAKLYKGSYLKGGGAFYKIDKNNFKILEHIYFK